MGITLPRSNDGPLVRMNCRIHTILFLLLAFGCCVAEAQSLGQQGEFSGLDESQQQQLLEEARRELAREQAETARLEQLLEAQDAQVEAAMAALEERLGGLSEFYVVLQTAVTDTERRFDSSLTRLQFPERAEFLIGLGEKIANPATLASIHDIDQLFYVLQSEIVESGKIVRFKAVVTNASGEQSKQTVVRVGLFNLVSNAGYLYLTEDGAAAELERQPGSRHTEGAREMTNATEGVVTFALDPTRGAILRLWERAPEVRGPSIYGPVVAFAVVALGSLGLMIAIMRPGNRDKR